MSGLSGIVPRTPAASLATSLERLLGPVRSRGTFQVEQRVEPGGSWALAPHLGLLQRAAQLAGNGELRVMFHGDLDNRQELTQITDRKRHATNRRRPRSSTVPARSRSGSVRSCAAPGRPSCTTHGNAARFSSRTCSAAIRCMDQHRYGVLVRPNRGGRAALLRPGASGRSGSCRRLPGVWNGVRHEDARPRGIPRAAGVRTALRLGFGLGCHDGVPSHCGCVQTVGGEPTEFVEALGARFNAAVARPPPDPHARVVALRWAGQPGHPQRDP